VIAFHWCIIQIYSPMILVYWRMLCIYWRITAKKLLNGFQDLESGIYQHPVTKNSRMFLLRVFTDDVYLFTL